MERIRTTFNGKEKQAVITAVLEAISHGKDHTANAVKDTFFSVQDKVLSQKRKIAEDKWPVVEKWLVPGVSTYIKLQGLGSKQNEAVVQELQKQLRESQSLCSRQQEQIRNLEAQVQTLHRQLHAPKPQVKKTKPSVVVVGLLHCQEQVIKARHCDAFALSFVTSDQYHGNQCEGKLVNAARILVMTDFVSHNNTQNVFKDKIILVRGGMSSLHRVMSDLII